MTEFLLSGLIALLILIGSGFVLLGSFGLLKLPNLHMRLHAPTKAATLGLTALLLASALWFSWSEHRLVVYEWLIIVFLWLTAPISALLIASAARGRKPPATEDTDSDRPC
ncbi:monovalent cation/H(+) antiporter subunit G [Halothiobacillus sp. DCM-1]|uniref:monovalent cation/H(+) antiporter subunit G n=1 Tax=Halothiobacillus sp. DCM-1 TaxID=3112558 RepID=UPI003248B93E